ncbi:hypothetical protein CQW23_19068, partial [Capsicum baccatum]
EVLPLMMRTLTEALNCGQEATAQEALELLIELAETNPVGLQSQIEDVVGSTLQIAEADCLEEGTRHLAIEFVITLAEARERAPGMMRLPQFISRLFGILLKMLLDIVDDVAWHSAMIEHESTGEIKNYCVGRECLDRLSIALGGDTIVPVAFEQLAAYLAEPEWQKHHAALIAVGLIADGCSKVMIIHLDLVINTIVVAFEDPHPRVRWAVIDVIARFSIDLAPALQEQHHGQIFPVLAAAMDDFQNPRVEAHSASAIFEFIESRTPETLLPYLGSIVSRLIVLTQGVNQMVREEALIALGYVANLSKEHFQEYYDQVMPYLKRILANANDISTRMLRAKAIECISAVMMNVGKDKCGDDAKQVIEVLVSIQGSQMETDDPSNIYLIKAWARLCMCLGRDFLPYMSVAMPPLFQSAQRQPDVSISSVDSEPDDNSFSSFRLMSLTLGDERYDINTSILEEKAIACKLLKDYVDELKEDFYPWIDQAVQILVPLLDYIEEFREAAVSALPEMLRSAKLAVEKGLAHGLNETYLKQLLDCIIPALLNALPKELDAKICSKILTAVSECLEISGALLDEGQVRCIVDEIKRVLSVILRQKQDRAERTEVEEFDAEESDINEEIEEEEEDLFIEVGDILGELIKTFKAAFLPFFDELSSYLMPMWGKDKTAEERMVAITIFEYVVEHCREAALKYYDAYVPVILEACNDESSDVRQVAAYGLGKCAELGGFVFEPFVGEAVSRLTITIRHPNALQPENVMAYDSAVSALGRICLFHHDSIDSAQVFHTWLNCLPIKADVLETKVVYDQLCSMVERSDGELLDANNPYLPKIVSVFAEVLCAGEDLASEQTLSRMINLLRKLQQTLPPALLASIWSSLQPQQQIALQSILSS